MITISINVTGSVEKMNYITTLADIADRSGDEGAIARVVASDEWDSLVGYLEAVAGFIHDAAPFIAAIGNAELYSEGVNGEAFDVIALDAQYLADTARAVAKRLHERDGTESKVAPKRSLSVLRLSRPTPEEGGDGSDT